MKRIVILSLFAPLLAHAAAEDLIHGMAGCYQVTYEFSETFTRVKGAKPSSPTAQTGLEWVELDRDVPGEIHLQHLLATEGGPLKHWRQEWVRQPSAVWHFTGRTNFDDPNSSIRWTKEAVKSAPDIWLQRVTQVDDSPRYECAARVVDTGNESFWECRSAAPLPRRESSQRSDYDLLSRRNRHELTSYGWVQEEDSQKIRSVDHQIVAEEKGVNRYRKVDDAQCAEQRNWWSEHRDSWHFVQNYWSNLRASRTEIRLKPTVNGHSLWEHLFAWADEHRNAKFTSDDQISLERIVAPYRD